MPKNSKKKPKFELSKNLMRMKFMKRGPNDGGSDNEQEQPAAFQRANGVNRGVAEQRIVDEERWVIGELPQTNKQVSAVIEIVEEPNFFNICGQRWNRMSFGGYNRETEKFSKLMNIQMFGDDFSNDKPLRQEDADVDDLEMANFQKRKKFDNDLEDGSEEGEYNSDDDDEDEELAYATLSRVKHDKAPNENEGIAAWSDEDEHNGSKRKGRVDTSRKKQNKARGKGRPNAAKPTSYRKKLNAT